MFLGGHTGSPLHPRWQRNVPNTHTPQETALEGTTHSSCFLPKYSGRNTFKKKKSKSILLKVIEIRLQRSTYTVIEEETSTHLVLTGQSSALHLWPLLGLLSPGRLSRRQHGGRFHACSYTCGSVLCRHRRRRSLGVQKHGADLQSSASTWERRNGLQHLSTSSIQVWLFPNQSLQLPEQMGQVQGRPQNTASNWKSCPASQ